LVGEDDTKGGFAEPSVPMPAIKKQRVVKPSSLLKTSYLETTEDVDRFISDLRQTLEAAIKNNERIQIR
jgi:hypothetical protein